MAKINKKYGGLEVVTISKFRKDFNYHILSVGSNTDYIPNLLVQQEIFGEEYEHLQTYCDVDFRLVEPILRDALEKLRKGEEVNLAALLEN